jgi:hypothetical protein
MKSFTCTPFANSSRIGRDCGDAAFAVQGAGRGNCGGAGVVVANGRNAMNLRRSCMRNRLRAAIGFSALLAFATASAHHSFAMFDITRHGKMHGTVMAFQWTNPHVWLWVVSDKGTNAGTVYGFEAQSINEMIRTMGWNRHTIKVGDKITVDYAPLRSGKNGGSLAKVTFEDGRVLRADTPPPPASHAAPERTGEAPNSGATP